MLWQGKENTMCNGTATTTCDRLPSLNSNCDTILNNNNNANNSESSGPASDNISQIDGKKKEADKEGEKVKSDIQSRKVSESQDIMWSVAKTKSGTPFYIFASSGENLSSRFLTRSDTNQPLELQRLARHLSRVMRKPTFWFPTWSDTNQAVQLQKMARGLKFWI